MRLNGPPVPIGVEHDHDESDRPPVPSSKELPLQCVAPVLVLEVEQQPIDLHGKNLGRTEQAEVHGPAMIAGRHLGLEMPRRMSDRPDRLFHGELAGIAERGRVSWIRPNDDVEPHRLGNGTERVQLDVRVAVLHPPY